MSDFTKDLIVMVADNDAQLAVEELLKRHQSMGIRKIDYDMIRHPQRDSGCRGKPEALLRGFSNTHQYALVIFDHHGSGRDNLPVASVESETRELLRRNGWCDRAEVVVIAPELETWMWSDSPEIDRVFGWQAKQPSLRDWIHRQGLTDQPESKPGDPKETYHRAVREVGKAVSASHFKQLAKTVSFRRCSDPSFTRFLDILKNWFNQTTSPDS